MAEETELEENILDVYSGLEVPLSRSYPISSTRQTKLVLILGPVGAGKTTLISRIFDQFHDGSIGDWKFAGSETIVGYESILRLYRSQDVNIIPAVDRTAIKLDPDLFHLNLKKNAEEIKAALLANLSGELFNNLIQANDTIEDMGYFQRAAHICIVLDGSKLINKAGRSSELRNAHLFLERLAKAKHISNAAVISIVIAKADIFRSAKADGFVAETISKIKEEIISPLQKDGINIVGTPLQVISEPFDKSEGYKEVLDAWMSDFVPPTVSIKSSVKSKRSIDHYKAGKK